MLTRRLDYPTRDAFRRFTMARVETLSHLVRSHCAALVASEVANGRNHSLAGLLEHDLATAEDCFSTYLTLPRSGDKRTLGNRGELFNIETRYRWSVIDSQLLTRLEQVVEDAELRLASPRFASFLSEWAKPTEQSEYFDWVHIVRLCLLVSVVSALDYEEIWRTLDGDGGWALSERVLQLASFLKAHPSWQQVLELVEPADSRWRELTLHSSVLEQLKALSRLEVAASRWRGLFRGTGSVRDFGVRVPASFSGMPPSPDARNDAECFARPKVWERLSLIRGFWDHVRAAHSVNGRQFEYVFVAASLRHGGRHQPHAEHRDGAEVDLDLSCLPDLVDHTDATVRFDVESGDYEILDGFNEPQQPGELFFKVPGDWTFPVTLEEWQPQAHKFRACGYPAQPSTENVALWYWAARKFSQCIYLTFPSSIIYASQNVAVGALEGLQTKAKALLRAEAASGNALSPRHQLLRVVVGLLEGIRPIVWQGKSAQTTAKIRHGHRNHWHVNFNPDRLGDEGGFSSDRKLDRLIDEAVKGLVGSGLWQELLAD